MDFKQLEKYCNAHSREGEEVLDWIMYYGGEKDKLAKLFDQQVKQLRHVFGKLGIQTTERIKAQYVIYRILRANGLIHKYLNHSAVKNLAPVDYAYLRKASKQPYRYAYLQALGNPAPDFFNLRDVFTGEQMLMYSPGIAQDYGSAMMFFALVSSNGECYQTYGPIAAFRGFDPDDIYFYATEWEDDITTEEELMAFVHKDPVKFSALSAYSNFPLTAHQDHALVESVTFADADGLEQDKLGKKFEVERSGNLYKCILNKFGEFPHFAILYVDLDEGELVLSAMTDKGYDELHKAVKKLGVDLPELPDMRVHPSMRVAMEEIFKRPIALHPYGGAFHTTDPMEEGSLEQINLLIGELIGAVNADQTPDLAGLARKYEQDMISVKGLYETILEKVGKL